MKMEGLGNLNNKPEKKSSHIVRNVALGAMAIFAGKSAMAQDQKVLDSLSTKHNVNYTVDTTKKDTVPKDTFDTRMDETQISDSELDSIYNKDKENNDAQFSNITLFYEDTINNRTVLTRYGELGKVESVKVVTKGEIPKREKFISLDELVDKYPEYRKVIEDMYQSTYEEYKIRTAWDELAKERQKTVSHDVENFVVSLELLNLIDTLAKGKNDGTMTTDGYDEIYSFLVGSHTSKEIYSFYEKYNLDPGEVGEFVTKTYFWPKLREDIRPTR